MIVINGQQAAQISALDRGLTLGDGFFTTLQVKAGQPLLWPLHRDRITASLQRLHFPTLELKLVEQHLRQQAATIEHGVLKLVITRGQGGRGYSPQGCKQPTWILSLHPFPSHYPSWRRNGIALGVCEQRLALNPMLAGLKTLNRLEQVLLKSELENQGWDEAVVLDLQDRVVEAVTANIFWRKDCVVYTPRLQQAGVCGVMRRWIMEALAKQQQPVQEVEVALADLLAADEVWISNALMEVVPVTAVAQHHFGDHTLSRRLQTMLTHETQN